MNHEKCLFSFCRVLVCLCCFFSTVTGQPPFVIESRRATGEVTDEALYQELGGWFAAGSTAKSGASAPELPGGVLQGAGTRFSFADVLDASYLMKIGAHPSFVSGEKYDVFITIPSAPTIDAENSRFVLYDDLHGENDPVASGVVPLTSDECGDVWYPLARGVTLESGAVVKVSESGPQGDRFYADAVRVQPVLGDCDLGLGRRAELGNVTRWEQWASGLTTPSGNAMVEETGEGLVFRVPEPGAEMSWRCSIRPAWMATHHYLVLKYRLTGELSAGDGALLRLCYTSDSWFTAVVQSDLVEDGRVRSLTVDLSKVTSQEQVIGLDLHLASGQNQGVSLEVVDVAFRDSPEFFQFAPAQPENDVSEGYALDLSKPVDFEAMPSWVGGSLTSEDYSVFSRNGSLVFTVREANKAMKWRNVSLGVHNTVDFPYVLLQYRCENLNESGSAYTVYLSGDGESRPFYHGDLIDNGVWHWVLAPVGIPSVSSMAVQVHCDGVGNGYLEIGKLAFVDGDPRTDMTYFSAVREGWDGISGSIDDFSFFDLGEKFNGAVDQLLPRMGIDCSWYEGREVLADDSVPFLLGEGRVNLVATEIPGLETIEVPVGFSASELYFLLGAFYPARESAFSESTIGSIDEMERLLVEVIYTDESKEEFFPVDLSSGVHQVLNNRFVPLAVSTDSTKIIDSVRIQEKSDGGLVALAAMSAKTTGVALYSDCFDIPQAPTLVDVDGPPYKEPRLIHTDSVLVLENSYFHYEFDVSDRFLFSKWISAYNVADLREGSTERRLFSGEVDGTVFTSEEFIVNGVDVTVGDDVSTATVLLSLSGAGEGLEGVLTVVIDESCEALFDLELRHAGSEEHELKVIFPDLPEISLGGAREDLQYAYPRKPFLYGSDPVSVSTLYSGEFPVQFMDLFDLAQGWGVYIVVQDKELREKRFGLRKDSETAGFWVDYARTEGDVFPAGETVRPAPFVLGVHRGDWHVAKDAYMDWVSEWYEAMSPRQQWFESIYTCRRDYPIGGTWRLFDRVLGSYTFPKLMEESDRFLGGADMIDISSWGWSSSGGRVGDYRLYELGGLDNFRAGIEESQGRGVPVGLYIEGYLIDERSTVYQEHGEDWQVINSDGSINRQGTEVTMCPYAKDWQDHMKVLYADVVGETGAQAMYIDVFGMGNRYCYSAGHGHAVGQQLLRGEAEMTRAVREGLNGVRAGIPLYTEFTPVDVISQYQDGSFASTIYASDDSSVTKTNLFRFCFPDFKQIEIVPGLFRARNWTEEGLKKAFFNGEGIWIKGDIAAWYDRNTIDFYMKSHEIFRDHRDAFTSSNAEPLIPTFVGGVSANGFVRGDKQLYMLYNSNWRDVSGQLFDIDALSDCHVVDLWKEEMVEVATVGERSLVNVTLSPRDIGCVVITPELIHVQVIGDQCLVRIADHQPGERLVLVALNGENRVRVEVEDVGERVVVTPGELFEEEPEKLMFKLKREGLVVDLLILSREELSGTLQTTDWVWQ